MTKMDGNIAMLEESES